MGADKVDVGDGIDTEEEEGGLGVLEFDVGKEELGLGRKALIVGDEGRGEEAEFGAQRFEVEIGVGVEMSGIEEDEEGVGTRGGS